ncbi:hypothetical protein ACP2YJ_04505 [Staphylococcus epidermidis]|uniref:hypothetical protein n=1 Tax=Staphylococcus epidermidis TaxID=1282 RepID=UPI00026C16DA|nr:hypothetical protein [Staphylococcus epidermidis]EJD99196.1 hypothetical protein HMPREF9985_11096 [Staphylococcus epidermidis NIHLM039]
MSQTDYQIKPGNIKGNFEETSSVSKIIYEIENANNNSFKKCQRLFDGWFYDYTWK